MRKVTKAAAAAMVLLAGVAARAQAADILPPAYQLEPDAMVEFGSGWYLRGDIGYSTVTAPLGSPPVMVDNLAISPTASSILNNRNANFGAMNASLGVGYQFNRWFRMDATFDWRQNQQVSTTTHNAKCAIDTPSYSYTVNGQEVTVPATINYNNRACYVVDSVSLQSWTGLLNAYGDLGTWFGVTPYVGAGVGFTSLRATANELYNWNDGLGNYGGAGVNAYYSSVAGAIIHYGYPGNVGPTQLRTNFSFALMSGIAYDIAPHLKLDIGYRYLNMGSLSVWQTTGNVVRKTVDAQEVRAGLRWTPDL